MGERAFSVAAPELFNCIPLEMKKSESSQSFRKKMKTLYFELERQTDNDNEPDLDLQRLSDRDTEDLGTLEVFHFIS